MLLMSDSEYNNEDGENSEDGKNGKDGKDSKDVDHEDVNHKDCNHHKGLRRYSYSNDSILYTSSVRSFSKELSGSNSDLSTKW